MKHHTSFESMASGHYVPVCSCGFRGACVSGRAAALAAANAHARAQGAEPLPPDAYERTVAEPLGDAEQVAMRLDESAEWLRGLPGTHYVVHKWGAHLCLAVTFCAGMAIGALIMVIFVLVG